MTCTGFTEVVKDAVSAIDRVSEEERIALAVEIIKQAVEPSSIQSLTRVAHLSHAQIREIQNAAMIGAIPAGSSVDPEFFALFLHWHNRPEQPTFAASYRHAVMQVSTKKLTCAVSSETVVRHALSKMRRAH